MKTAFVQRHARPSTVNAAKADKYRSAATAKIIRNELKEHNDHNLARFTDLAVADLEKFAHMEGSDNKNTKGTYWTAVARVREGVEAFASVFWPEVGMTANYKFTGSIEDRNLRAEFCQSRIKDIRDLARLEANAK